MPRHSAGLAERTSIPILEVARPRAPQTKLFDAIVVGARANRPGLRDRSPGNGTAGPDDRKGLHRQLALQVPDQPHLFHHSGTVGDRQHPDDGRYARNRPAAKPSNTIAVSPATTGWTSCSTSMSTGLPARTAHSLSTPRIAADSRVATKPARSFLPRASTTSPYAWTCRAKRLPKVQHYYREPHPFYDLRSGRGRRPELGSDLRVGLLQGGSPGHLGPPPSGTQPEDQVLDPAGYLEPHQDAGRSKPI